MTIKRTKLGQNGPEITQFGLGAMSFAGIYGQASVEDSHAVLDATRAAGVSHIDTANVYGGGRSEEIVGSWLAANPGARETVTIATKAGITGNPERRFDNSAAYLENELDGSLARLGVDYVDLFYIHRREADIPIEDVTGSLARLVEKGKVRGIGYSEIAPTSLRKAHAVHPVTAVQSEYSLSTRAPDLGMVQTCAALGVAFVAFSPVGRSLLTDKPFSKDQLNEIAFLRDNPRFTSPNFEANLQAVEPFRALARDMGVPTAALAIAWTMAQGDHVIPIPGTKSLAHLEELLIGARMALTSEDVAAIEAVLPLGWAHGDRYTETQWIGPEKYG